MKGNPGGDVINKPRAQGNLVKVGTIVGQSMGNWTAKVATSHEVEKREEIPWFLLLLILQPPNSAAHWPVLAGSQLTV